MKAAPPTTATWTRGKRYVPIRELGRGGFGAVWLARDQELGRTVAIKELTGQLTDAPALQRFGREARLCAKLRHPHVVQVLDFGSGDSGDPYLVYEFLDGGSASDRVQTEGPFPEASLRARARELASALSYLHEQGLVHRDIKPANVLLRESGEAVLGDFGLVHDPEGTEGLTRTGEVLGTPGYLAPELWLGQSATPATDQFALGLTLLVMARGAAGMPWATRVELQEHLARQEDVRVSPGPDISPGLARILERTLAFDPADRYPECRSLERDLAELVAEPPAPETRVVPDGAVTRRVPAEQAPQEASRSRDSASHFWIRSLASGLGALVLLGLLWPEAPRHASAPIEPGGGGAPEPAPDPLEEHVDALDVAVGRLRRHLREPETFQAVGQKRHAEERAEALLDARMPLIWQRVLEEMDRALAALGRAPAGPGRSRLVHAVAEASTWLEHLATDLRVIGSTRFLALQTQRAGGIQAGLDQTERALEIWSQLERDLAERVKRLQALGPRTRPEEAAALLGLAGLVSTPVPDEVLEHALHRAEEALLPRIVRMHLVDGVLAVLESRAQSRNDPSEVDPALLAGTTRLLLPAGTEETGWRQARAQARAVHLWIRSLDSPDSDHERVFEATADLTAALASPASRVDASIRRIWLEHGRKLLPAQPEVPSVQRVAALLEGRVEAMTSRLSLIRSLDGGEDR